MGRETPKPREIGERSPLERDPAYVLARDRALQRLKEREAQGSTKSIFSDYKPAFGSMSEVKPEEPKTSAKTMFYRGAMAALLLAGVAVPVSEFEFNKKNSEFYAMASPSVQQLLNSGSLEVVASNGSHEYYSSAKHKFFSMLPGYVGPDLEAEYFRMAHAALGVEVNLDPFMDGKSFNGKPFADATKADLAQYLYEKKGPLKVGEKQIDSFISSIPSSFKIMGISSFGINKADSGTMYVVEKNATGLHYDFTQLELGQGGPKMDVKIYSQDSFDAFVQAGEMIDKPGYADFWTENHALASWADALIVDDLHNNSQRWNVSEGEAWPEKRSLELHYHYVMENSNKEGKSPEIPKDLNTMLTSKDSRFLKDPDVKSQITDYRVQNGFDIPQSVAFAQAKALSWTEAQTKPSYKKAAQSLASNPPPGLNQAEQLFAKYGHLLPADKREAVKEKLGDIDNYVPQDWPK